MFTLNFLQLKLEDYKDRLKKGEALNQDQLVSLLYAGVEGLKTFWCGRKAGLLKELRVFLQKQCLQACEGVFHKNKLTNYWESVWLLSPWAQSPLLTFMVFPEVKEDPCLSLLCRLSASVLLNFCFLMKYLYAADLYGNAVLEPKPQEFWDG